ncbi:MAG: hypothetical protein ACYT04_90815, partial [Nostoc sp.]
EPLQQAANQTFNPTVPNIETRANVDNNQPRAALDTVPAMLTLGKFATNKADTQKNLNFLEYLKKGGTEEDIVQRKTTAQNNYSSPPLIFRKSNSTNILSGNNL